MQKGAGDTVTIHRITGTPTSRLGINGIRHSILVSPSVIIDPLTSTTYMRPLTAMLLMGFTAVMATVGSVRVPAVVETHTLPRPGTI